MTHVIQPEQAIYSTCSQPSYILTYTSSSWCCINCNLIVSLIISNIDCAAKFRMIPMT